MFDLEQAIAEWRKKMGAGGVNSPEILNELESHLRDDVEKQMQSGLDIQKAFDSAANQLGPARALHGEFRNAGVMSLEEIMKQIGKISMIILGLFGMVLGLAMVLPALGKHQAHPGPWIAALLVPLCLGLAMLVLGALAAFLGIRTNRRSRGRTLIKLGLLGVSAFYSIPVFITFSRARELNLTGWIVFLCALAVAALYFTICFRLNRRSPASAVS